MGQHYSTAFAAVSELDDALRREMARLYLASYDGSSEALFLHDLAKKDEALLVRAEGQLVGFTTLRVFEHTWESQPICVVYSGDTVVEREHWGQQALAFDWIARMGALKRERPEQRMVWLLLVKGHRTFRYLPLFVKSFHPHWSEHRPGLQALAHSLAGQMFPDHYNPATGVVEFRQSRGHLKSGIADPSSADLSRQDVRFFLERNPGFRQGHELVCLCEIDTDNLRPLTLRLFQNAESAPVEVLAQAALPPMKPAWS